MIPIPFVTIDHALTQRRLDGIDEIADLQATLWQASDACLRHIKIYEVADIPATWLSATIPDGFPLQADYIPVLPASYSTDSPQTAQYVVPPGNLKDAILLYAGEMWEKRESGEAVPMSPAVLNLLEDLRYPTLQ